MRTCIDFVNGIPFCVLLYFEYNLIVYKCKYVLIVVIFLVAVWMKSYKFNWRDRNNFKEIFPYIFVVEECQYTYYPICAFISFSVTGSPKGASKSRFHADFFAQITPRNCPKFMFTPSLPNHAGCQIDFSRNHAIIFTQFTFSRYEICPITPSRFPLRGPLWWCTVNVLRFSPDLKSY